MPTIIMLDVSLSMSRLVGKDSDSSDGNYIDLKQLANVGIGHLLDYFAQNAQLEYTAFIVFSSLWEIRQEFTRHHETIKNGIYDLEIYDKSNVVNAIRGSLNLKPNEWIQNGPMNIILITDGQVHHGSFYDRPRSVESPGSTGKDEFYDAPLNELENLFDFPCKIQVVCLASPQDPLLNSGLSFYKKIVSLVDSKCGTCDKCPVLTSSSSAKQFKQSAIWLPESDGQDISVKSVEDLFSKICELHYKPFHTTLTCGHLCSLVMLSPRPVECLVETLKNEFDELKNELSTSQASSETFVNTTNKSRLYRLNEEISICGFVPVSDVSSPAVISRHLLVPIHNNKYNETSRAEQVLSQDPNAYNKLMKSFPISGVLRQPQPIPGKIIPTDTKSHKNPSSSRSTIKQATNEAGGAGPGDTVDIAKQPCFCVLLQNGLKQENMVAICIVGKNEETQDNWYGMLHCHVDTKKRTSMILSLFSPGPNPIPWLPSLYTQGSSQLNADLPQSLREKLSSTVNKPPKSYSTSNVIWLDPESVQADVQKIVRQAKRSADKAAYFYKEVNRIRRAAISYGFYDVLFGLADILEREKKVMQADQTKSPNQVMLAHIDHVIRCLRTNLTEESYDTSIAPMSN